MIIRPETPADIPAIHSLHKSAFMRDSEAALVAALRAKGNLSLSLVADDNGVVVGHVGFSFMKCDVKAVGLAPLAVAEDHRRHGIGGALVEAGLKEIKTRGFDAVFVLGSEKYYPQFGFLRAIDFGIHSPYPKTENNFFVLECREGVLKDFSGSVSYAPEFKGL